MVKPSGTEFSKLALISYRMIIRVTTEYATASLKTIVRGPP